MGCLERGDQWLGKTDRGLGIDKEKIGGLECRIGNRYDRLGGKGRREWTNLGDAWWEEQISRMGKGWGGKIVERCGTLRMALVVVAVVVKWLEWGWE
ncbi:hypothetical protein ACH5RR_021809 [Cinchona calisaya]|uniref:Uncharacterized protein n=1 Tax=Cinchona calisaya TaxID=153742 RepID=A0ABD2ZLK6_9GENT